MPQIPSLFRIAVEKNCQIDLLHSYQFYHARMIQLLYLYKKKRLLNHCISLITFFSNIYNKLFLFFKYLQQSGIQ
jgi:hypothetical protein